MRNETKRLTEEKKEMLIKAMVQSAEEHYKEGKRLQRLGSEIGPWRESGATDGYHEVRRYLEKAKSVTMKTLDALMEKGRKHIDYSMSGEDEESKAYDIAKAFAIKDAVTMVRGALEGKA